MKSPFFSVVIPTYNSKIYLIKCLESLENQTFKNFEVIVVDDGSNDGTYMALQDFKRKTNIKIKIFRQKRRGPAAARNLGIKKTGGKIIAFTDADCIVPRDWLSTFVRYYHKYPTVVGIGGYLEPSSNNVFGQIERVKNKWLHRMGNHEILGRKNVPVGFTNNMSYKKHVLKEVHGFNERFKKPAGEDPELKNRVAENYDLLYIPLKVKHLETYDSNYFLRQILKRGTEKKLEKMSNAQMIVDIIKNFPQIIFILIKKTLRYKESYKNENRFSK